jgi:RNA polymerase sigma-70 factor (ECF subfamily)
MSMTQRSHNNIRHLKLVPNDAQQGVVASDEARQMSRAIRDVDWAILMARAQNGDSAAYQRLLEGMTPYLRSLALRWYHDPQDIEDAIQDVFLTVHVIRHTYDPARPFGPWLVAIANRRFVDRLRRQSRQRLRETSLTTEHETFLASDANHEGSLDWIGLESAIENLPPKQQQAISLLKLKEMPLKEAAKVSGMSIASLKVATHRALKSLRQMLTDRHET